MENLTASYITRAEIWLFITTLLYFLINGAQVFETAVIVPKWTANAPYSFSWLTDKNGMSLKSFWIIFHSVHEVAFILAIVFCWKIDPVRNWLLILFVLHFAVRVWTILYFAPNIIGFEKAALTPDMSIDWTAKASLWKTLNYLRVGLFIAISIGLIPLCMKLLNLVQRN